MCVCVCEFANRTRSFKQVMQLKQQCVNEDLRNLSVRQFVSVNCRRRWRRRRCCCCRCLCCCGCCSRGRRGRRRSRCARECSLALRPQRSGRYRASERASECGHGRTREGSSKPRAPPLLAGGRAGSQRAVSERASERCTASCGRKSARESPRASTAKSLR